MYPARIVRRSTLIWLVGTACCTQNGDVVKHQMSFSFLSDMHQSPAKPMQLVWAGANRLTAEGEVAGPEHQVSLD